MLRTLDVGVLPVAAVIDDDGTTAWISDFGGPKPASGDRAARQCCDPMAEPVRIDARGIAEPGTVAQIDLVTGTITKRVVVGRHPTGIAWDQGRGRLYVADGNSDAVTIVNTRTGSVTASVRVTPFTETRIGLAPTAVALAPDGRTLYVALGGVNAVAVYDVSTGAVFKGLIPTGWYPSSLDVSRRRLDDRRRHAARRRLGHGDDVRVAGKGGAAGVRGARVGERDCGADRRGTRRLHHVGGPQQPARPGRTRGSRIGRRAPR